MPRAKISRSSGRCLLHSIDSRTFLFLVHETPMFALQVMRSLADRIQELDEQRDG